MFGQGAFDGEHEKGKPQIRQSIFEHSDHSPHEQDWQLDYITPTLYLIATSPISLFCNVRRVLQ